MNGNTQVIIPVRVPSMRQIDLLESVSNDFKQHLFLKY